MFRKKHFIISLLVFASSCFSLPRNYSSGWNNEVINLNITQRYFRFYVPKACPENAPVIFVLHNFNSGMEKVFHSNDGFNEWPHLAEQEKFILVSPNGTNRFDANTDGKNQEWNDCRNTSVSELDDVQFIDKLIKWSKENLSIDEKRVYLAGVGNGGMMAYRLAAEIGNKLAGIAVFLANMPGKTDCKLPSIPLPIFVMNSVDDPIIPFNGGVIAGGRGEVLSAEQTLNFWVNLNQLNAQKRTNKFYDDINPDENSIVIKNEFDRPLENPPVIFNVITNAGHNVPSIKHGIENTKLLGNQNRDVEGVVEAWKFLKKFSLK